MKVNHMQKKSELFFNTILLPIDFLAVVAAFIAAYAVRVKIEDRPVPNPLGIEAFLSIVLLILPLWILIFALLGLYNQSSRRGRLDEIGKIFSGVAGGFMLLVILDFFSRTSIFPAKAIPVYGFAFSLLFVTLGRMIIRRIQRWLFASGIGVRTVVLIGSGPLAVRMVQDLSPYRLSGYKFVGMIEGERGNKKNLTDLPRYQSIEELCRHVDIRQVDEFIQADSVLRPDELLQIMQFASNNHLNFRFIPNELGLYAANAAVGTVGGLPIIEIRRTPLYGWGRIIKRLFDFSVSMIVLFFAAPLMGMIALAIKVLDPGPIIFRHQRLSRTGKPFYIYKFRTMKQKYSGKSPLEVFKELGREDLIEEFKQDQKVKNDPRVSGLGDFLRKSSLDELPQLLNVLKGELSLVGPRPIVEAELEKFGTNSALILSLKPGITGLWQVSGRNDISYEDRVKLNIYYVENWSLWMDIKILFKTAIMLLKPKGAY